MRADRSRTAQPLRGPRTQRAMGAWGLMLTLLVLAMFVAGLATAALYLETGQPGQVGGATAWPPDGIHRPGWGRAGVSLLLTAAATIAIVAAARTMASGRPPTAAAIVFTSVAAWVAAALMLAADLASVPFRWDEHAYTSVYWVLTGTTIIFVAIAVLVAGSVLIQILTGVVDADRNLELTTTAGYAIFTLATAVVLLGLVHLLPIVADSP